MAKFAGISELTFHPLAVVMDAVAETQTDVNMRPKLGPLATLDYKPTEWRYLLELSATPTQGSATITLYSDGAVVASETVALSGNQTISNRTQVAVSAIAGESRFSVGVDVTSAADAGITATLHSVVSVEQPTVLSGC
jgi:hypothetical protein